MNKWMKPWSLKWLLIMFFEDLFNLIVTIYKDLDRVRESERGKDRVSEGKRKLIRVTERTRWFSARAHQVSGEPWLRTSDLTILSPTRNLYAIGSCSICMADVLKTILVIYTITLSWTNGYGVGLIWAEFYTPKVRAVAHVHGKPSPPSLPGPVNF